MKNEREKLTEQKEKKKREKTKHHHKEARQSEHKGPPFDTNPQRNDKQTNKQITNNKQ